MNHPERAFLACVSFSRHTAAATTPQAAAIARILTAAKEVGYAANNVLFYVKGGAAVTDNRYEGVLAGTVLDRAEETRWGGTIGAGVEYAFAPNWSFGVEYNHLFMGDRTYNFTSNGVAAPIGTPVASERIKQDADMVTVRVNYRWGGLVVAKY